MIQSGVLRIFRMAVRGVCSLSALPVCFVSLLVRPVLSVLSCSVLFCPALSARPSARLSIRSAVSPPVHLFCPLCPLVQPSVCPFVRLFRLLCLSAHSSPSALLIRPRPLCSLCLSAHSCPSALSVLSALPVCSVHLSARPAPEPPNFIPPISPSALFFLCGMIFPCPISDTLLKSRRGELGISDNNSYLWMQKMSFAHKNTTGYNEKS